MSKFYEIIKQNNQLLKKSDRYLKRMKIDLSFKKLVIHTSFFNLDGIKFLFTADNRKLTAHSYPMRRF